MLLIAIAVLLVIGLVIFMITRSQQSPSIVDGYEVNAGIQSLYLHGSSSLRDATVSINGNSVEPVTTIYHNLSEGILDYIVQSIEDGAQWVYSSTCQSPALITEAIAQKANNYYAFIFTAIPGQQSMALSGTDGPTNVTVPFSSLKDAKTAYSIASFLGNNQGCFMLIINSVVQISPIFYVADGLCMEKATNCNSSAESFFIVQQPVQAPSTLQFQLTTTGGTQYKYMVTV